MLVALLPPPLLAFFLPDAKSNLSPVLSGDSCCALCFALCRLLYELCDEASSEIIDVSAGGMVTAATGSVDEPFNADGFFDDCRLSETINVSTGGIVTAATGSVYEPFSTEEHFDHCLLLEP